MFNIHIIPHYWLNTMSRNEALENALCDLLLVSLLLSVTHTHILVHSLSFCRAFWAVSPRKTSHRDTPDTWCEDCFKAALPLVSSLETSQWSNRHSSDNGKGTPILPAQVLLCFLLQALLFVPFAWKMNSVLFEISILYCEVKHTQIKVLKT